MWLAIALSFLFYIPVVLWADAMPMMGMLMIPKTCAYAWIVVMGFRGVRGCLQPPIKLKALLRKAFRL